MVRTSGYIFCLFPACIQSVIDSGSRFEMEKPRKLLLLRHGKAATRPSIRDFERSLAPRGRRDVPTVAFRARKHGFLPELALCSPAQRTRETADLFLNAADCNARQAFVETLYLASAEEILDNVAAVPAETRRLLVVGHNMGMAHLVGELAGAAYPYDSLSTSALVVFEVDAMDWNTVANWNCRLAAVISPKIDGVYVPPSYRATA